MDKVYDNLYVGDVNDADNPKRQEEESIEYILNLSGSGPERDSAPSYETVKEKHYIHIPLADGSSNTDFLLQQAITTAQELHQKAKDEDVNLLIHCAVGASRSPSIAAALTSLENEKRVFENVNRIKKVRPVVNPSDELLKQVNRLTTEIYKDETS